MKRIIKIKKAKEVIFVGDTHGDLEASKKVIKDYLKPGNKIVFLGDYVDRGPASRKNIEFLLKIKSENPDKVFLLQGNHEGYSIFPFSPANFWESLNREDFEKFSKILLNLPLIAIVKDIIALHGALPDLERLENVNKISPGDKSWLQITWGDFVEERGEELGEDPFSGRPKFGRDYFFKLMKRFKKKILIRSHDPSAPQFMFDQKCLTIFTSSAYNKERTVAIFDFEKEIKSARDLEIKRI